jgi:hypothetical protein
MSTATLYKIIDLARNIAGVLVGVLTYLASASDVLHLPAGVTGAIAGVLALASHYGIRQYTTPAGSNTVGRRSISDEVEAERLVVE